MPCLANFLAREFRVSEKRTAPFALLHPVGVEAAVVEFVNDSHVDESLRLSEPPANRRRRACEDYFTRALIR